MSPHPFISLTYRKTPEKQIPRGLIKTHKLGLGVPVYSGIPTTEVLLLNQWHPATWSFGSSPHGCQFDAFLLRRKF